jgi:hypothetical protein
LEQIANERALAGAKLIGSGNAARNLPRVVATQTCEPNLAEAASEMLVSDVGGMLHL